MGLYLCRWENGDFSVVQAERQTQLNDGGNWRRTFSAIFITHISVPAIGVSRNHVVPYGWKLGARLPQLSGKEPDTSTEFQHFLHYGGLPGIPRESFPALLG